MSAHWTARLKAQRACPEAIAWAHAYDSPEAAWAACPRADWLLWVADRLAATPDAHRAVIRAAAACARTALPYWEARFPVDRRLHDLYGLLDRWVDDPTAVSIRELRASAEAAAEVASAVAVAVAWAATAAWAVAMAAWAAEASAAWGAWAAQAAAWAAEAAASRLGALAEMADLVRAILPCPVEVPR